jgi:hypothetical protein
MRIMAIIIAAACSAAMAASTVTDITVDFNARLAPYQDVYQANERTFDVYVKNRGAAVDLTGSTPTLWWAVSNGAVATVNATLDRQTNALGYFRATFSPANLNTNSGRGSFVYGVTLTSTNSTTARIGEFKIIADPYAAGVGPVVFTTNVNFSTIKGSGTLTGRFAGDGSALTGVTATVDMSWSNDYYRASNPNNFVTAAGVTNELDLSQSPSLTNTVALAAGAIQLGASVTGALETIGGQELDIRPAFTVSGGPFALPAIGFDNDDGGVWLVAGSPSFLGRADTNGTVYTLWDTGNFLSGVNYLAPNGSGASLTGFTPAQIAAAGGLTNIPAVIVPVPLAAIDGTATVTSAASYWTLGEMTQDVVVALGPNLTNTLYGRGFWLDFNAGSNSITFPPAAFSNLLGSTVSPSNWYSSYWHAGYGQTNYKGGWR